MSLNYSLPLPEFLSSLSNTDGRIRREFHEEDPSKPGYYPYIPMGNSWSIISTLSGSGFKDGELKFLDIGAGTGRIVALAKYLGYKRVCGVEVNPVWVKAGRKAYGLTAAQLICQDAFDMDKAFIDKFDRIYFYCPIADHTLMRKLFIQIYDLACEGALLVEMLPNYLPGDFGSSAARIVRKYA